MNTISKIIKYGFIALLLFGGNFAYAGNVSVEFERTPLFSEANFLPEDSISRFVKVINNTGSITSSFVRATNVSNRKLGDFINLKIKKGETIFFDGTMTEFFDKSSVALLNLPIGEETRFDFIATFLPTNDNEYQDESISFNLQMIFEGGETIEDTRSSGGSSLGGSHLLVYNEKGIAGTPAVDAAEVTWSTNIPATSQVIYGKAGVYYPLDSEAPNFGYPNATEESLLKVTNHNIVLGGLDPGEYVYRVVSRASPATVSPEFSFMIGDPLVYAGGEILGASVVSVAQNVTDQTGSGAESSESNASDTKSSPESPYGNNLANVFSFGNFPWWLFLFILFLILATYVMIKRSSRRG